MLGFKSAILAIFQFSQNGTFKPMHEIKKKNPVKSILLKQYENCNNKNFHSMSQGPTNPGLIKKDQKGDFLKKP
jgi:hypothetical protein